MHKIVCNYSCTVTQLQNSMAMCNSKSVQKKLVHPGETTVILRFKHISFRNWSQQIIPDIQLVKHLVWSLTINCSEICIDHNITLFWWILCLNSAITNLFLFAGWIVVVIVCIYPFHNACKVSIYSILEPSLVYNTVKFCTAI